MTSVFSSLGNLFRGAEAPSKPSPLPNFRWEGIHTNAISYANQSVAADINQTYAAIRLADRLPSLSYNRAQLTEKNGKPVLIYTEFKEGKPVPVTHTFESQKVLEGWLRHDSPADLWEITREDQTEFVLYDPDANTTTRFQTQSALNDALNEANYALFRREDLSSGKTTLHRLGRPQRSFFEWWQGKESALVDETVELENLLSVAGKLGMEVDDPNYMPPVETPAEPISWKKAAAGAALLFAGWHNFSGQTDEGSSFQSTAARHAGTVFSMAPALFAARGGGTLPPALAVLLSALPGVSAQLPEFDLTFLASVSDLTLPPNVPFTLNLDPASISMPGENPVIVTVQGLPPWLSLTAQPPGPSVLGFSLRAANCVAFNSNGTMVTTNGQTAPDTLVVFTNPTAPMVADTADIGGTARCADIGTNLAVGTTSLSGTLVDATTPSALVTLGSLPANDYPQVRVSEDDLSVHGVDASGTYRLFDTTNPASPMQTGTLSGVDQVRLEGATVFVNGASGFRPVNATSGTPNVLSTTFIPAIDFDVANSVAYFVNGTALSAYAFDGINVTLLGSQSLPLLGTPVAIEAQGPIVVVVTPTEIAVFDVTMPPPNAALLGVLNSGTQNTAAALYHNTLVVVQNAFAPIPAIPFGDSDITGLPQLSDRLPQGQSTPVTITLNNGAGTASVIVPVRVEDQPVVYQGPPFLDQTATAGMLYTRTIDLGDFTDADLDPISLLSVTAGFLSIQGNDTLIGIPASSDVGQIQVFFDVGNIYDNTTLGFNLNVIAAGLSTLTPTGGTTGGVGGSGGSNAVLIGAAAGAGGVTMLLCCIGGTVVAVCIARSNADDDEEGSLALPNLPSSNAQRRELKPLKTTGLMANRYVTIIPDKKDRDLIYRQTGNLLKKGQSDLGGGAHGRIALVVDQNDGEEGLLEGQKIPTDNTPLYLSAKVVPEQPAAAFKASLDEGKMWAAVYESAKERGVHQIAKHIRSFKEQRFLYHLSPIYAQSGEHGFARIAKMATNAEANTFSERQIHLATGAVKDMLEALSGVHGTTELEGKTIDGVTHGDAGPANWLFDYRGRIYLADFGRSVPKLVLGKGDLGSWDTYNYERLRVAFEGGTCDGPKSDAFAVGLNGVMAFCGYKNGRARTPFNIFQMPNDMPTTHENMKKYYEQGPKFIENKINTLPELEPFRKPKEDTVFWVIRELLLGTITVEQARRNPCFQNYNEETREEFWYIARRGNVKKQSTAPRTSDADPSASNQPAQNTPALYNNDVDDTGQDSSFYPFQGEPPEEELVFERDALGNRYIDAAEGTGSKKPRYVDPTSEASFDQLPSHEPTAGDDDRNRN